MPKQETVAADPLQLSPRRIAALGRWLNAANRRLVTIERGRKELVAAAKAISEQLEPRPVREKRIKAPKRPPRSKLAAKLAKAG